MKATLSPDIEKGRVKDGPYGSTAELGSTGAFMIFAPTGAKLYIIASDGTDSGWDHCSVSVRSAKRLPTWEEMAWVKSQWFDPEECVVQYHPPESEYVNFFEVLHLFRPIFMDLPLPPTALLGPKKNRRH